ncbi:MAG: DNA-processing protein DprA [Candidatus Nanopelagicales bacterium]|jgi:DNA processing protein|nr:DNA-processing protein DprA [Candidatus Nanopelagicales bacterium]MDP4888169.1 DNA-processing protein DprA [Candidatus Nanopelagicales bacterium]
MNAPTNAINWSPTHQARALLLMLTEGGDADVWQRINHEGDIAIIDEVLTGRTKNRFFEKLRKRLPLPTRHLDELIAEQVVTAESTGARLIIPGDAQWPTQLNDLAERAPLGLWVVGTADLRLLALRSVAIVGARAATTYGLMLSRNTAATLADHGWLVVSGGAFGIDAAAHQGALDAGGSTACVLAGGIDVTYPRAHEGLFRAIAGQGLLISEAALGASAQRQRFLTRNRIISALTRSTVVVEAALRSGSRTTAREAEELFRLVMAYPGPVTSSASAGCHELIKSRLAVLVSDAADVLSLLGETEVAPEQIQLSIPAETDAETDVETVVFDQMRERKTATAEGLARDTGFPVDDVVAALGLLELAGLITRNQNRWRFRARHGS